MYIHILNVLYVIVDTILLDVLLQIEGSIFLYIFVFFIVMLFFTGTSAQQLDASFNTTAALEIFEMDFADPSLDMKLKGSLPTTNR